MTDGWSRSGNVSAHENMRPMGDVRIKRRRTVAFLLFHRGMFRSALLRFISTCCGANILTKLKVRVRSSNIYFAIISRCAGVPYWRPKRYPLPRQMPDRQERCPHLHTRTLIFREPTLPPLEICRLWGGARGPRSTQGQNG